MATEEFRVKKRPFFSNLFLSFLSGEYITNTGLLLSSCLMLAVLSPEENDKKIGEKNKMIKEVRDWLFLFRTYDTTLEEGFWRCSWVYFF